MNHSESSLILPDFVARMRRELINNTAAKGDWRAWQPDVSLLDSEMRHHLRKLNQAVLDGDRAKVSEYAADVACYALKYFEVFGDGTGHGSGTIDAAHGESVIEAGS